jgi:hypothetical protein
MLYVHVHHTVDLVILNIIRTLLTMTHSAHTDSNEEISSSSLTLAIKQAFLIAHINGLLWLRRYPASIVFTTMIPFSFLFIVFVIGGGQYTHLAFAGTLVAAAARYGLATGNNIINWKVEYKIQMFLCLPRFPLLPIWLALHCPNYYLACQPLPSL